MSQRKDTCIRKACPFWARYKDKCPNYVKGEWETNERHRYDTHDCAPKRSMILVQQMYDQIIAQRRDYHQLRNATVEMLRLAATPMGVDFITEGEVVEQKLIEDKSNG